MISFYSLLLLCGLGLTAHAQIDSVAHHLKEVVVLGHDARTDNLLTPQTGGVVIKGVAIANMPVMLGEPDVLKALQTQTGVSSGIEGFTGIYVRGGENDQNLYMLHRLPLYNVNHLGGLFSSFNVAMVENVKFFKAGFPAEYGGRVASVTDIQLKRSDFEEYHGQASIGLLSGNLYITGPIIEDRLAFSASVRRSWMELVTIPTIAIINNSKKKNGEKIIGRYSFMDINLKLDYNITDYIDGFTHFYLGRDRTKLGSENFSSGDNSYLEKNTIKLNWGSIGAVTCLNFKPTDNFFISADAYITHFDSKYKQNAEESYDDSHAYSYKNDINSIEDYGASLRASLSPSSNVKIEAGTEFIHHIYKPEELEITGSNGFGLATPLGSAAEIFGNELSLWENNTFAPFEWLQLNAGVRFTQYSSSGKSHKRLEPRANIRVSLTDFLSIKAGYARTNQYVQQLCNSYVSLPTEPWIPIADKWEPLKSDIVSAGIYGDITDEVFFAVEGYYKWMDNLLEYREDNIMFTALTNWNDKLTSGRGEAYGIDLSVNKNKGRLTGTVGYGLMWNNRQFDELNRGEWFPAKYDNRHKINVNCQYEVKENVMLNVAWTYMSGNRMTLSLNNYKGLGGAGFDSDMAPIGIFDTAWGLNEYGKRNNVRLPAYHRLDLGVSFIHKISVSKESILNIGLYNAYSRMNPIVIKKDGLIRPYIEDGPKWRTKFRTLGLLPVIPSISYTYKF